MSDGKPLWERQAWDTATSFDRFQRFYLPQTPQRSVDSAYQQYFAEKRGLQVGDPSVTEKRAPGIWRTWSSGQDKTGQPIPGATSWKDRAAAYDDYLAAKDREVWEARRRQIREDDFADGQALRDLGRAILDEAPKFTKSTRRTVKGENGQPDTVIYTVAIDAKLMAQIFKLASELEHQAAGDPTATIEHSGNIKVIYEDILADDDDDSAEETA